MNTASTAVTAPTDSRKPIAPLWHTLVLLAAQLFIMYNARKGFQHLQGDEVIDRVAKYQHTILTQWCGFIFVLFGVWLARESWQKVLGRRWRSPKDFFADLGLGLAFLFITILLQSLLAPLIHADISQKAAHVILPQSSAEIAWWIVLSLTAGICEETLYRGYFQAQFIAYTRCVPVGIVLSAFLFGLAHSYQGWGPALQIGVFAAFAGWLTHWRKSVRPVMFSHALQDIIGGLAHH